MWVLIWAALLLSLTERTKCQKTTASPWTITIGSAEITAEMGLCAVIPCTFTHPDNVKPNAAKWFKCAGNGKCDYDKNIIFHSKNTSKAQEGFKQRVSLLETDLTKKNCSVIINDIRENDAGEYQFRIPTNGNSKKVNITVRDLTQKPSVLTPPLTEGEPATLTCTAPGICSGTPPNITWTGDNITELRDNTTIQKREDLTNVTTTHFSTLTFTPSAENHNMMVTCQVTFQKTYQIEETVTLHVTYLSEGCGNAVLPWTIAGVSLSVTFALLIYQCTNASLRMRGKNMKPTEEESTYISLDKKCMSQEEYEVIARRPR